MCKLVMLRLKYVLYKVNFLPHLTILNYLKCQIIRKFVRLARTEKLNLVSRRNGLNDLVSIFLVGRPKR